jgi:hypothetical protein
MQAFGILTVLLMTSSGVLWCIGVISMFVYNCRLRRLYPDIAARIAPSLLRKSMSTDLAGVRFLLLREYRALDRKDFVRFCDFYRLVVIAFLLVFAAFLLCSLFGSTPS